MGGYRVQVPPGASLDSAGEFPVPEICGGAFRSNVMWRTRGRTNSRRRGEGEEAQAVLVLCSCGVSGKQGLGTLRELWPCLYCLCSPGYVWLLVAERCVHSVVSSMSCTGVGFGN